MSPPTGQPLDLMEVCAILSRAPFNKSKAEIMSLDRWWIAHVLFHPTDKHGEIRIKPKAPPEPEPTPRQEMQAWGRGLGLPAFVVERYWRAYEARHLKGGKP